jgi:ABC-type sugar transport system ATPase subunit
MTMGDRIAVMRLGVLQQVGTPEELYTLPRNLFVAGFIGSPSMNLVPAPVVGMGGEDRIAGFRPEHLRLAAVDGAGHRFNARVEVTEYLGDELLVHLARNGTTLLAKLPVEQRVERGSEQEFAVPSDKMFLFDRATEERVA